MQVHVEHQYNNNNNVLAAAKGAKHVVRVGFQDAAADMTRRAAWSIFVVFAAVLLAGATIQTAPTRKATIVGWSQYQPTDMAVEAALAVLETMEVSSLLQA